ncbi:hypothetical protein [Streptosporangium sp. KLBMP 9127]|nr:hypothetical protein [Streptosporangium sp. KLBMP 9127]
MADRAQKNAEVIRRLAEGGEPVYQALLPFAANLEQAVVEIEAVMGTPCSELIAIR